VGKIHCTGVGRPLESEVAAREADGNCVVHLGRGRVAAETVDDDLVERLRSRRRDVGRIDPDPVNRARTRSKEPLLDDGVGVGRVCVVEEKLLACSAAKLIEAHCGHRSLSPADSSAFDREAAVESVLELDQASHHHQVGDVLLAAERAEHACKVAGRCDRGPEAVAERLTFGRAAKVVIALRAFGERDDLHLAVVGPQFDHRVARVVVRLHVRLAAVGAAGVTYGEVLKAFTTTVRFTVDPASGKIVPSHLNATTAPFLCRQLKHAEEEYVREFDAMAEGMAKILKVRTAVPSIPGGTSLPVRHRRTDRVHRPCARCNTQGVRI
jgi:hypothetical protein